MLLPPLKAPLMVSRGSAAAWCGAIQCPQQCSTLGESRMDCGSPWSKVVVSARIGGTHRNRQKLHMDFVRSPSIGHTMDERELRGLFTEIGCIMEDASTVALVWHRDDARSKSTRAIELRDAYNKIGTLLDVIDARIC